MWSAMKKAGGPAAQGLFMLIKNLHQHLNLLKDKVLQQTRYLLKGKVAMAAMVQVTECPVGSQLLFIYSSKQHHNVVFETASQCRRRGNICT
jgi:hypothetical protein